MTLMKGAGRQGREWSGGEKGGSHDVTSSACDRKGHDLAHALRVGHLPVRLTRWTRMPG